MAIAKIPREIEREKERERCHDEDVCNLFLTRIEFHHATTIFVPPHAGIIIRLGPREYCNGFPYKISRDRCCRPFAPQLSALPLCVSTGEFWPVAEGGEEGAREMWSEGGKLHQPKTVATCWVGEEQSLASIDHRGNNNSGTRTGRFECGWIANGASIVCIVRLGCMCVALVCIVAMMHPPMDREEARYNLPMSIGERGGRVGMGGLLEFSSGIFFLSFPLLPPSFWKDGRRWSGTSD